MSARATFLDQIPHGLWERVTPHGESIELDAGETVLRRGDPPHWLYVVTSGSLVAVDPRTTPVTILSRHGPGDVVAELSYIDGGPVSAEVRADEPSRCWRFDVARIAERLRADPEVDAAFHRALAVTMSRRVRHLTTSAVTGAFAARQLEDTWDEPAPAAPHLAYEPDPLIASLLADQQGGDRTVPLRADRVRIGRSEDCEIVLSDPHVEPVHAELVRVDGRWRVVSIGERAVVVGGSSVASAPVDEATEIRVGRAVLRLRGEHAHVSFPSPVFSLHVERLGCALNGRTLLSEVTFTALAGEVIALVGPSGAGKTTLLNAIAGTGAGTLGRVRLDHEDLWELVERVPTLIGEVPQDDVVSPALLVEESLSYAAKLRLPHLSRGARAGAVNTVLTELGLESVRRSRIGDPDERGISGGQRKRVNVAPELLAESTRILFLDEPTSGLDPRSAEEIARLARRLADAGRIVVFVTHDLSDGVLSQVDQLLVMAVGGHLAWFGPLPEALTHFGVRSPARIFGVLGDLPGAEQARRYHRSPSAERWVRTRARLADARLAPTPPPRAARLPSWPEQWWTLVRRTAVVKVRDPASVGVLVVQPLVVAAVILGVFPRPTSGLLFLLTLSSYWFGMSAAVRELIADRGIWRRERRIGIRASAWVLAKATVLAGAVGLQVVACTFLAFFGVGLAADGFSFGRLLAALVLTGWVGVGTGLLVSSAWKRADAAVGTLVLLLVPQMAFVGMLTPLDQLPWLSSPVPWFIPLRYAFHLTLVCGESLQYFKLDHWYTRPVTGELYLLGLRPPGEGSLGMPASQLAAVLAALFVAQLVAAIAILGRARRAR